MLSLSELLAYMEDDEPRQAILPEAAIARLREYETRIHAPCPFKVGDLVVPRSDAPVVHGAVESPYLVIEVLAEPQRFADVDPGNWPFWSKIDVVLLYIYPTGKISVAGLPHWMLEPYTAA